jgi:hypothetical protein
MGTTGTGRFHDYAGGKDEEDRCDRAFTADLEDVATCAFYREHESLPSAAVPVRIRIGRRLTVVTSDSDEEVGHLPTEFNYLRACMKAGRAYEGMVRSSAERPLPRVTVDIAPAE